MAFTTRILLGLGSGIALGLFFGEWIAPIKILADIFVKLLQMSVLPFVVLSIVSNLGKLNPELARQMGRQVGWIFLLISALAILISLTIPWVFPALENASFFHPAPSSAERNPHFLDQFIPANPFASLANNMVPAVVLISMLFGLALMNVPQKQKVLAMLDPVLEAVSRMAKQVVSLTPYGLFAIAAHAAGTLELEKLARIEVFLVAYIVFSLLLSLWVLPALVSTLTPIRFRDLLSTHRDSLLTAFLVGDLFIVLPALMEGCSALAQKHLQTRAQTQDLPGTIAPISFTLPHSGKLLSLSFIPFAAWLADVPLPLLRLPELAVAGFFSAFGGMNISIPFLLDLLRIPSDTFQFFLVTGVVNARFGALLSAVHTIAICLLGTAALSGSLRFSLPRVLRLFWVTAVLLLLAVLGMRNAFSHLPNLARDGRQLVYNLKPLAYPPVAHVLSPMDISPATIPHPYSILSSILARKELRIGIIGDGIPYAYRNQNNQLIGLDVEMAQRLAQDLGVRPVFVRFPQEELSLRVSQRVVDIVITGARLTPERAADFVVSDPYLLETLAVLVEDHRRGELASWAALREKGNALRIGVQNLPYYFHEIQRRLPNALLETIPETKELLDPQTHFDAYLLPAERGSVLTMLHPRFSVVIPEGPPVRMPLAYPLAGADAAWIRYVNAWITLKKNDGFLDALYDHWIRGRAAESKQPRWSVMRDLLGWTP